MTAPFSMNAYIMYGWTLREEFNKEVNHVAQKLGVQTYHVILIIVIILIAIGRQQLRSPIGPTQLLNCKWNSCDIDDCQMLKYQSSQSYKVLHLLDLSFLP